MKLNGTINCCVAWNLNGFGHAHHEPVHRSFHDFANAVYSAIRYKTTFQTDHAIYGFTNSAQKQELEWLKEIGFKAERVGKVTIVYASVLTISDFFKSSKWLNIQKENQEVKTDTNKSPRRRGEFRVGDRIYRFRCRVAQAAGLDGMWYYDGVVTDVYPERNIIRIRTPDGATYEVEPRVNNGWYNHTIERRPVRLNIR